MMVLAERLNIADIYTFDRRDFAAFRPSHRAYLRLLP
jgi:predicted nucleic acid-binding protein